LATATPFDSFSLTGLAKLLLAVKVKKTSKNANKPIRDILCMGRSEIKIIKGINLIIHSAVS